MENEKQQKPLNPVYLAVGPDALKRRQVVERLKKRVGSCTDLSFNLDELHASEVSGQQIVDSCNMLPFLGDCRLVIVHAQGNLAKPWLDALTAYVQSPNPQTILCLECDALAKNTRLYKAIDAISQAVIECPAPKESAVPALARSIAVGYGAVFSERASVAIARAIGPDTLLLDQEIKKIALAHEGPDPVSEEEVLAAVQPVNRAKPWDLADAFGERNAEKCWHLLAELAGESPLYLLAQLQGRARELIIVRARMGNGKGGLEQLLGKKDWQVKRLVPQARAYSEGELARFLDRSVCAERAMKSGSDQHAVLQDLLLSTVHGDGLA